MGKTITIIIIALLIILGIYYLVGRNSSTTTGTYTPVTPTTTETGGYGSSTSSSSATTTPAPVATSTSTTQVKTVTISNYSFQPATITVKAGTKVTWVNRDSVAHSIVSDTETTLNSAKLGTGESYSHTFTQAGTFNYHCSVHPSMKGTVIVTK